MVETFATGALFVLLGVAALVATRRVLPRIEVGEDYRSVVQLLVALGAGMTITLGLLLLFLGLLAG